MLSPRINRAWLHNLTFTILGWGGSIWSEQFYLVNHLLRWIHLEWTVLPWQSFAEVDLSGVNSLTLTILCWSGSIWSEQSYLDNPLLRWIHLEWTDLPWQSSAEVDPSGANNLTFTIICWGGPIFSKGVWRTLGAGYDSWLTSRMVRLETPCADEAISLCSCYAFWSEEQKQIGKW